MPSRVLRLDNLQQFTAVELQLDGGAIGGPKVIPQCVEICFKWAMSDGKGATNVLHASYSGPFAGTQAQANSILTALTTGAQWTALAGFLAPTGAFGTVTIQDLNSAGNAIISSTVAGKNGTSTGTALPDETAFVLTFRAAKVGRENRGRLYIPIWASNALGTGGTVAAGAVTAAANWGGIIAGAFSAQGYVLGIGHQARQQYTGSTGTVHPARAAGVVPIVTVEARDNHWDSQRRRGLK